jgi:hypothetical protein
MTSILTERDYRELQAVELAMALGVKQYPVGYAVAASMRSPDFVMAMPSGECGNPLSADWAYAVLFPPEVE